MTICAAAINLDHVDDRKFIHLIFDKQATLAGGVISADGTMWKLRAINSKWCVMFAGDTSDLFALRDAVIEAGQRQTKTTVRNFARLCVKAYREERKNILETNVLAHYDIESYAEYLNLKDDDRKFFDQLTNEIEKTEEEWSLLICGFDDVDEPHIFVISNFGKIEYCDLTGFACIGSGMWPAYAAMASYPYKVTMPLGESVYCLLAAKFAAETADGVGQTCSFLSIQATDQGRSVPGFDETKIENVKELWRSLPKIPPKIANELENSLRGQAKEDFRIELKKPRKRKPRKP